MNEESKTTIGDTIQNVLNTVEGLPHKEGAEIMYHFLNGILIGGAIDINKGVKTPFVYTVDKTIDSSVAQWFDQKENT